MDSLYKLVSLPFFKRIIEKQAKKSVTMSMPLKEKCGAGIDRQHGSTASSVRQGRNGPSAFLV
jgi:hypothetical protein